MEGNNLNKFNISLICNNCLGGRFYKIHEFEFNNPFMWNLIEPHEFVRLIKNFDKINLGCTKFEIIEKNKKQYVNAVIGYNINLNYIHYIYDETKPTLIKIAPDILGKDILQYVVSKYFERLLRMPKEHIFLFTPSQFSSEEHFINANGDNLLNELNELGKKNNIIVILDSKHKLTYVPNFKVIYEDNLYGKNPAELLYHKGNELDKKLCTYIFND